MNSQGDIDRKSNIITYTTEGNGSVTHKQAVDKAMSEYRKYKTRSLSGVEKDYLDSIKILEQKTDKN